jgi:hypothetical protein
VTVEWYPCDTVDAFRFGCMKEDFLETVENFVCCAMQKPGHAAAAQLAKVPKVP